MNSPSSRSPHLPALTGFRGLAALMVFFAHYIPEGKAAPGLWAMSYGARGVDFFFVLSGYLFTWLYAERFTLGARWELGDYFRKRFARILPPFWTVALLSWWLLPEFRSGVTLPVTHVVANLLLLQGYTHAIKPLVAQGWTLSIEELFYASFPFIVFAVAWVRRRGAAWWVVGFAMICLGVIESWLWAKFVAFAVGMLLAWFLRRRRVALWFTEKSGGWLLLALGVAFFIAMPLLWGPGAPPAHQTRGWSAFGLTCFSAMSGVCLLAAALADTTLKRMLSVPAAVFFGRVSYCFYLVHMLILCLCKGAIVSGLAQASGLGDHSKLVLAAGLMFSLSLSVGAAWVLHAVIEEPSRCWLLNKDRWQCLRSMIKPAPSAR